MKSGKNSKLKTQYLKFFCLLFCLVSFSSGYGQRERGWKSDWKGDCSEVKILEPGLDVTGVAVFKNRLFLDATKDNIKLSRELSDEYRNTKTLWISFSVRKIAGNGRLGLSLLENSQEKLFVGAVGQDKTICFGSKKCREKMENAVQLILRVEKNKAYLFINPPLASVPDVEGASMTLSGDFSFDRITFLC